MDFIAIKNDLALNAGGRADEVLIQELTRGLLVVRGGVVIHTFVWKIRWMDRKEKAKKAGYEKDHVKCTKKFVYQKKDLPPPTNK